MSERDTRAGPRAQAGCGACCQFLRGRGVAPRCVPLAMVASDGEGSKRPANTPFKQQTLKAWRPILTPCGSSSRSRQIGHLRADRRGDPRLVVDGGRADDPRLPPHLRRRRRRERLADRPQPVQRLDDRREGHAPADLRVLQADELLPEPPAVRQVAEREAAARRRRHPAEDARGGLRAQVLLRARLSDAVLAARRLRPRLREQRPGARHLAVRADRVVVLQRLLLPQAGRRRLRARGDLPPRHRVGH